MRLPILVDRRKTVGFMGLRSQERKEKTMKTLKRTCIGMAFLLALTTAAQAVDLFTPVSQRLGGGTLVCMATNVSSTTHSIEVQLLDFSTGNVVATNSATVAPGTSVYAFVTAGATAYCKITVSGTSNKQVVRGAIWSSDSSGEVISALPAN
jgi:hypothetical protein